MNVGKLVLLVIVLLFATALASSSHIRSKMGIKRSSDDEVANRLNMLDEETSMGVSCDYIDDYMACMKGRKPKRAGIGSCWDSYCVV